MKKKREDYILNHPGAYDPVVPDKPDYVTHKFLFLEKYKVSHDWPYGFDICKYATMTLPKNMRDGTWYGSYNRLGDIFEYRGNTLQEVRVDGYPERSFDVSYMSIDNHVKTWKKVDGLGVERTYGYQPICDQNLVGSSLGVSVSLFSGKPKWLVKYTARKPTDRKEKYFFQRKYAGRTWLVREKQLKKRLSNGGVPGVEQWFTPIADTGYYYSFVFSANSDSPKYVRTYKAMRNIFDHILKSLRVELLSKEEAKQARAKVKKLIKEIEAHAKTQ